MQLAMREWRGWDEWRGPMGAVVAGLVLGILGPFGSQTTLATGVKYAFWMALALAGWVAAKAAWRLLGSALGARPPLVRLTAVAVLSAVPMTFVVAWLTGVVRPGRTVGPVQILALYPYVALVQLFLARASARPEPPPAGARDAEALAEAVPAYPPELLGKLPAALRGDILALEAEDHYLRVHTRHGSALILMRLADAAAMIDARLGMRVHRSWWVARDGVEAFESSSGRGSARLADGTVVPVSRSHLPAARAALQR
jgi:hypothetical protein